MPYQLLIVLLCTVVLVQSAAADQPQADTDGFRREVAPLLRRLCMDCHDSNDPAGNLALESVNPNLLEGDGLETWRMVYEQIRFGDMPPTDADQPSADERAVLLKWIRTDARTMTRNFTDAERQAGRLPADWQYSLPSEEQWEYAARAGTTSRFFFGDDMNRLPRYANFGDKAYYDSSDVYSNAAHRTLSDGAVKLARLGSYEANPWGFHDIYGNVAEWCINYAIRGGSWASVPENCRSAYRDSFSSRNEQNFIGYRLVIQTNSSAVKKE